jgi:hypothetical protein
MKLQTFDCVGLVDAIAEVIEEYMETHPDVTPDEVAATVSYVHGCMFRLSSETPPSKLH